MGINVRTNSDDIGKIPTRCGWRKNVRKMNYFLHIHKCNDVNSISSVVFTLCAFGSASDIWKIRCRLSYRRWHRRTNINLYIIPTHRNNEPAIIYLAAWLPLTTLFWWTNCVCKMLVECSSVPVLLFFSSYFDLHSLFRCYSFILSCYCSVFFSRCEQGQKTIPFMQWMSGLEFHLWL